MKHRDFSRLFHGAKRRQTFLPVAGWDACVPREMQRREARREDG
jgi:hypothetical protein